jgi:hypothetical protein
MRAQILVHVARVKTRAARSSRRIARFRRAIGIDATE